MRMSQFTVEKILAVLREADFKSVAGAAKKSRVGEQTLCVWRKHSAGLDPAEVNRWKALALDDAEPKRLLAKRLRGRVRTRASPHPLQQRTPSATLGPPVFASA